MSFPVSFVFLMALSVAVNSFPRNAIESVKHGHKDFESSGNGPDEPIRGSVKVVKINPHFLRQPGAANMAGMFGRGVPLRGAPSLRGAFPAFLAMGRPGPSLSAKRPVPSLPHRRENHLGADAKRRQGLEMWQRVMDKSEHGKEAVALPISPKDAAKQSCAAVPFTQRVTGDGCEAVTVHNKLCFGQCSSMFVPPGGEATGLMSGHGSAPCSRCAPSRARTVVVPLRCGMKMRERRVMVVEECKCETGREERKVQARTSTHL